MEQARRLVANLHTAEDAIAGGDEYVAAMALLPLTDEPLVTAKISRIAAAVPGGLLYDGNPPYFVSFVSPEKIPLANWPHFANKLQAITLDGSRAIISDSHGQSRQYILNVYSGDLELLQAQGTPARHSLEWVVNPAQEDNLTIQNTRTLEKITLCAPANSHYRWSRDASTLVATDGGTSMVYIINIAANGCEKIKLADLDGKTEVLLSPDGQTLVIILPGTYGSSKKSVLMTARRDGTGIKKVAELPATGRVAGSEAIISPDGQALYLDGFMVSLSSGAYAMVGGNVIAWLDSPPPGAMPRNIQLTVSPQSGERGTKFIFEMSGLPVGQEVSWVVLRDDNPGQGGTFITKRVEDGGRLTAEKDNFYFNTGLATEAGTYYLIVYEGEQKVGLAVFSVTEP